MHKPIKNFPMYRVHDDGKVESFYSGEWNEIGGKPRNDGYRVVNLRGKSHRRAYVHQVVAESFHGERPSPNHCVRHLDGNSRNNSANNIAWGTYAENEADKKCHGTWKNRISNAKLTPISRKFIDDLYLTGMTHKRISEIIGVSRPTVTRYVNRVTWS